MVRFSQERLALRFKLEGNGHGEAPAKDARGGGSSQGPSRGSHGRCGHACRLGFTLRPHHAPGARGDDHRGGGGDAPGGPSARDGNRRGRGARDAHGDAGRAPSSRQRGPSETEPTPTEDDGGGCYRGARVDGRRRPFVVAASRAPRAAPTPDIRSRRRRRPPRALRRRPSTNPRRSTAPSRDPTVVSSSTAAAPRKPSGRCPAWTRRCGKPSSATPIRSRATSCRTSNAPNAPNPTSNWATGGDESWG